MSPGSNRKSSTWSAVNCKKHVTSMSCRLEPAIWSRDTGQQIPCYHRCQLIITWMPNVKGVHGKPRLHVPVNLLFGGWPDRAEKRLRMRHLRPSRRLSAGKSRLEQQIPNVKSVTERWRYFVDFLHDCESFYFPKRFIYLRGIAFSGPYHWNFRKARDFVYFIDPLLCIVASRAAFSRHRLLTSR